ncbi:hypothetical protein [Mesorhizobium sp. M0036]|uniref:hypothetical protein n=1 Tax=Mesorhizobium sp. M0036 TaxID=2956853 RepID=UPI003334FD4A
MKGLLLGKWGASVAALVAVLVATNVGFQNVGFKADLLTSVIPNLLASFLAIAAVTERATAVLTEIWFGEQRKQQEERVRVAGKDFNAKRVALEKALNTHEEVIKEAFRSSKPAAMAHAKDIVVGPDNLLAGAREQISNQGKVLETVNVDLAVTESKIDLEIGVVVFDFVGGQPGRRTGPGANVRAYAERMSIGRVQGSRRAFDCRAACRRHECDHRDFGFARQLHERQPKASDGEWMRGGRHKSGLWRMTLLVASAVLTPT